MVGHMWPTALALTLRLDMGIGSMVKDFFMILYALEGEPNPMQ